MEPFRRSTTHLFACSLNDARETELVFTTNCRGMFFTSDSHSKHEGLRQFASCHYHDLVLSRQLCWPSLLKRFQMIWPCLALQGCLRCQALRECRTWREIVRPHSLRSASSASFCSVAAKAVRERPSLLWGGKNCDSLQGLQGLAGLPATILLGLFLPPFLKPSRPSKRERERRFQPFF